MGEAQVMGNKELIFGSSSLLRDAGTDVNLAFGPRTYCLAVEMFGIYLRPSMPSMFLGISCIYPKPN